MKVLKASKKNYSRAILKPLKMEFPVPPIIAIHLKNQVMQKYLIYMEEKTEAILNQVKDILDLLMLIQEPLLLHKLKNSMKKKFRE